MLEVRCFLHHPRLWAWWKLLRFRALQRFHNPLQRHLKKPSEGAVPPVQLECLLHNLLHPTIAPVLIKLEITNEACSGNPR